MHPSPYTALLQNAATAPQLACLHSDGLLGLVLLLHCLDVLLRDGGVLRQDGPELITSQGLLLQQLLSDLVNCLPVVTKAAKKKSSRGKSIRLEKLAGQVAGSKQTNNHAMQHRPFQTSPYCICLAVRQDGCSSFLC